MCTIVKSRLDTFFIGCLGLRAAAYSTFCTLWRKLLPHIRVMKPMSDLCWVCQQNSTAIMRSAHLPPGDKSEVKKEYIASFIIEVAIQVVKKAQEHLDLATKARSYYRGQIEDAKRNVMAVFPSTPALRPGLLPRTHELTIHLSFDMAQQVRTQMNTCYHQL